MPLVGDNFVAYEHSLNNYNRFIHGKVGGFLEQYIFFHYPELSFFPSFISYPLFGNSEDIVSFQGTIFLVILIIASYLLGKELFDRDVGLLAAVLISFSPFILAMSKVPFEDITFAAMFTLTLYFFIKSKKFSDIKYIWFFNISLALTLISKFTSVFVLLCLFLFFLFIKILSDRSDFKDYFSKLNKRHIVHFLLSFFVSMFLPLLYFITSVLKRFNDLYKDYNIPNIHFSDIVYAIFNYIKTLPMNFEHTFVFVIFIVSFVLFLSFSKKYRIQLISAIIGTNIYHFIMIFLFPLTVTNIYRFLIFIKPVYIIIISLFFIEYLYKFISALFKRANIRFLNKARYSISLIIFFLVIFIPFTLVFNYTMYIKEPANLYPLYGKYRPARADYDIKEVFNKMINKGNETILNFFPQNYFLDVFNLYALRHYDSVNVANTFFTKNGLEVKDKLFLNAEKYTYLLNNNTFNLEKLKEFDYVIVREQVSEKDLYVAKQELTTEFYEELPVYDAYYPSISSYLKTSGNFDLFRKIKIDNFNTTLIIYKNRI